MTHSIYFHADFLPTLIGLFDGMLLTSFEVCMCYSMVLSLNQTPIFDWCVVR